jgi:voltage-gated potassium channel
MSSPTPMPTPMPSGPVTNVPAPSVEALRYGKPASGWRRRGFEIVFESDTPAGRRFDVVLLGVILASVVVVMLETVERMQARHGPLFFALEWGFTALFTGEYLARLAVIDRPGRYARSFFGLVDLAAVLPMYAALFVPGLRVLLDVRVLRLLRAFRILKLTEYIHEYRALAAALNASRHKILVFLSGVAMVVILLGTVMYLVEGPEHGFTSIPVSLYWATSTLTTVGFGDIAPRTPVGRAIATVVMLLGWGVLAVPTGIVTAEMTGRRLAGVWHARHCPGCGTTGHTARARFCQDCGRALPDVAPAVRS